MKTQKGIREHEEEEEELMPRRESVLDYLDDQDEE